MHRNAQSSGSLVDHSNARAAGHARGVQVGGSGTAVGLVDRRHVWAGERPSRACALVAQASEYILSARGLRENSVAAIGNNSAD
jgi:hypothetical protein